MTMDIEKICRTCLGLSGPLLSIYDSGGGGGGCIADMLRDFTKTKPRPNDKLPERVCLSCISEINRCYSFKLKCENSCRTLRQLLPDALPEEPNEPPVTVKAVQHDKSVQTQPEGSKQLTTVCTQTKEILEVERTHQHVQTSPVSKAMQNMSTSPIIFEQTNSQRTDKVKLEKKREKGHREEIKFIETKKFHQPNNMHQSSLPHNNRNLEYFEQSDAETNEIIMEFDAGDTEINENVPAITRYSPLRAEQEESDENAITHYQLTTEQSEYESENHATNSDHNLNEGNELRDDIEYVDEEGYARFTYTDENEELNSGDDSSQKVDYNFTLVASHTTGNGQAESGAEIKKSVLTKEELKCGSCTMTFVNPKRLAQHESKRHGADIKNVKEYKKDQKYSSSKAIDSEINVHNEDNKNSIDLNLNEPGPKSTIPTITPQPIVQKTKPAKLVHFCECCGAGFALRKSLIYHTKQDLCNKVNYRCEKCDRVFISLETLTEHEATHLQEHECTECRNCFETNDELGQHMIKVHKRNLRNQCPICKKVFTILSALKDHLRVHSGEKPFVCTICDRGFSQKTNLKQHIMRHSKEKKFKCPECPMSFVTKGELGSHQRTHTGEHPFRCDECQATFTISSSLVKHKRIHTGERPYACDLCPKRFTSSFTLKNHRRVHTGEKPFKCRWCSKSFTQKQDCIIHHRTHTGERNHACFCGEKFTHLGTLRTHMKTHDSADSVTKTDGRGKRHSTRSQNANTKRLRESDDSGALNITILDVHEDDEEEEGDTYDEKATVVTVECEDDVSEEKLMQLAIEEV